MIVTSLLGGMAGDRFGPKGVLVVGTLLTGLLGAARGLANSYLTLVILVILLGALIPFVTMSGFKSMGQWFPRSQLGLANGLISMGMALGFLLGALFSATLLSPLLGGWRPVLIAYGIAGALLSIPWFFSKSHQASLQQPAVERIAMRTAIRHVTNLRNIWLLGFTLLGVSGAIQGMLGYLPLHLRTIGWEPALADGALSAFHLVSMLFVLPFALWSDRLGSRKRLLLSLTLSLVIGTALLSVATGPLVWVAVLLAGFTRDAFMAIYLTMVIETEGVGAAYAGTATGLTMSISGVGNVLAPPLGNSLAGLAPGAPFAFWSGMALAGMFCLTQVTGKPARAKLGAITPKPTSP
jgi:MFS family permease